MTASITPMANAVPEPFTLGLTAIGLLGLASLRRRSRGALPAAA
jgi:hypothetical protein